MHFALDFKLAKLSLSHVRILPLSREAEGDDIVVKIFQEASESSADVEFTESNRGAWRICQVAGARGEKVTCLNVVSYIQDLTRCF